MTDLVSTIQRVSDLLTRAGHEATPEEEARTSAVLAARLIRQHGLIVVHEKSARQEVKSSPKPAAPPPAPSRPRPKPTAGYPRRRVPEDAVGHRIMAPYDGKCKGCRRSFLEGEYVIRVKDYGVWHPGCWDENLYDHF